MTSPAERLPLLLLAALALVGATACGGSMSASSSSSGSASASASSSATMEDGDDYQLPALPPPAPISREEYSRRRRAFAEGLNDGIFVAFGSVEPELDYLPYAQNAPFRYLTGITEAGAGLIMVKRGGSLEELLFVMPRSPEREIWEGARLGSEGAAALTGIRARSSDDFVEVLDSLAAVHPRLYVLMPMPDRGEDVILTREQQIIRQVTDDPGDAAVIAEPALLERIRGTKSATELDLIRRAVLISVLAHREAMRSAAPGMNEFEIQAAMEYIFRRNGVERPAYSSIVGSGPNSTTLHYRAADRYMNAGELLLMDVGASYRGYAADVTRTVPVSGRFTADQRAIYDIVLEAQTAAEAQVRAGASWGDLDRAANTVISNGLTRLGLIDAPGATYDCVAPAANNRCPQFRLFYMHGLGHGVGLDVHDPDASYFGNFAVGSAFTIEPGIYVRSDVLDYLPDTPANRAMMERLRPAVSRYRDIGVRIEDVYLITASGVDRASSGLPRAADEVEALMRERGLAERDRLGDVVEWYRATTPR